MEKEFSYDMEYTEIFGKGDHLGDLEKIVGSVALSQDFELEKLSSKIHDLVLWSPDTDLLLKKGEKEDQDYRFFLCHHEAEFEENHCLASERYVFFLNHEGRTRLRLSITFTGYSDHDGDNSGVSNVRVNGLLFTDEPLPLALYEKLASYDPKRK
jgi:hypothetical protein